MREKFLDMYIEFIEKKFYFHSFWVRATFLRMVINTSIYSLSFAGIAAWLIWPKYVWVWAVLLAIVLIVNTLRDFLPFSRQIFALNMYMPELDSIINNVDHSWGEIDSMDESSINNAEFKFRDQYLTIGNRYLLNVSFSLSKALMKKAVEERKAYFLRLYNMKDQNAAKETKETSAPPPEVIAP